MKQWEFEKLDEVLTAAENKVRELRAERDQLREALEWARDMILERTTIRDQKFYRPTMEKIDAALSDTGGQDE